MRWLSRVRAVRGPLLELEGPLPVPVGAAVEGEGFSGETIGFGPKTILAMAYGDVGAVHPGMRVSLKDRSAVCFPTNAWKGRVLNALGEPLDGRALPKGTAAVPLKRSAVSAMERQRIGPMLDTGVAALNLFVPCCMGQRLGIFAGPGVGKSVLVGQIARFTKADVVVVGLIGERGREVRAFLEDDLGAEGLKNAVVVVSTGDESPLLRKRAAYLTLAIAEFFRDQGQSVLCIMDSLTRFALAQRELGLAAGEPPTTRGYPPSLFSEMPKLLERAGPGEKGAITAFFTVLVEGDDAVQDPVADLARGMLDGHVLLSRSLAERNQFPAVDVLKSLSRMAPGCYTPFQKRDIDRARALLSTYADMEELIRLGAYTKGTDKGVDEAIAKHASFMALLAQSPHERVGIEAAFEGLGAVF